MYFSNFVTTLPSFSGEAIYDMAKQGDIIHYYKEMRYQVWRDTKEINICIILWKIKPVYMGRINSVLF